MSGVAQPAQFGQGGYGQWRFGGGRGPLALTPEYYVSLVTSEYQQSPKMLAWLRSNLQPYQDINILLYGWLSNFDIDLAVGVQLDTLGVIVGQSRTVGFQPSAGVSPILDDETYRILLKARIAQNHWDGKSNSLQAIWQNLFPGGRIAVDDGQNMTATILLSGSFTSITQDLIIHGYIVARPQGVLYNYVLGTLPLFGFDLNN